MPSAADFLPSYIRLLMNLATTRSPYLASGMTSRFSARRRRDIGCLLFRALGAVERSALLAVLHALRVENAADDVIANAGKILHATAAQQHHRVLLQIVAFARDVADDFVAVGETNFRDLAQRRVRLFWRRRINARADAPLLRTMRECGHLVALGLGLTALGNQLIDRRHSSLFFSFAGTLPVSASRAPRARLKTRFGDRPLG